jgi:hypothetical protein
MKDLKDGFSSFFSYAILGFMRDERFEGWVVILLLLCNSRFKKDESLRHVRFMF